MITGRGLAVPNKVFVIGRSNGATTTLLIRNKNISDPRKDKLAGAFPMQPSCLNLKDAEFHSHPGLAHYAAPHYMQIRVLEADFLGRTPKDFR